jgi:branched-subunit amino acid transport protein
MLVCPAIAVASIMILLAHSEHTATTIPVFNELSGAYKGYGSASTTTLFQKFLQPFPSVLAMAISRNVPMTMIIAFGFLANSFQITCNSFIGASRILVAMGADGILPSRLALDSVQRKTHSPNNALWFYFFCSVPFIIGNSFSNSWSDGCTFAVTVACGFVFAMTSLAATRIPSHMRAFWMGSEIGRVPSHLIKLIGYVAAAICFAMIVPYLLLPSLWPTQDPAESYLFGVGLLVFAFAVAVLYKMYQVISLRRPVVTRKIREVPKDLSDFYE